MEIKTVEALRALYDLPRGRSVLKELTALDVHCKRFIELSPFVVIATVGASGHLDSSPRGGDPGFVKTMGDDTILIADSPGNNRLDSIQNILETHQIGLLFMVPGVEETLRVNGSAVISVSEQDILLGTTERRAPKVVIRVTMREAYLHCAKALMRSRLWDADQKVDRAILPSMSQMIDDQTGGGSPVERQEDMRKRYESQL